MYNSSSTRIENTSLNVELSSLLSNLLVTQKQYVYFVVPATPSLVSKVWDLPIVVFSGLQAGFDIVTTREGCCAFLLTVTRQVEQGQAEVFGFAMAELGMPTGLFVYGVTKKRVLDQRPIFFGGGMIAQVCKKEFTVRKFPENFWAGTPSLRQLLSFRALLVDLSVYKIHEKFEKSFS